ncbi:MAG: hypothetical protein SVU32_07230 [Candidatus Nanohaloarchaea archaeon]|nr:hypothetical protein [Candidatus Nanohaloarchaea archaeon]
MQDSHHRLPLKAFTVLVIITGLTLPVAAAQNGGGGSLLLTVGIILVVIGVMGNMMFFGYAFMTGSLSLEDILPLGGSSAEETRQRVQSPPSPQPPQAGGQDQPQAQRQSQGQRGSGSTARNQQQPENRGSRRQDQSGSPQTPGESGTSRTQHPTNQPSQQSGKPDIEDLKRDAARIQAILESRREVENRGQILRELDNAMTAVDNDNYREARSSLDRIKQLLQ